MSLLHAADRRSFPRRRIPQPVQPENDRHVVVIGAGPGGLAASMLLRRSGARVTLVERRDRVGGRTSALEKDGFRFDIGPTFFLYPRVLEEIFRTCGYNLHEEVELTRLDPQYRLVFEGGGRLDVVRDPARMKAQIEELAPGNGAGFEAFMRDNRRKLERFKPVLSSPFNSPMNLLRFDLMKALPVLRPRRSVDEDLARHFTDHRIRLAFSFQSKYLGMSPYRCPSLFTILAFLEHEYGVWHPTGGCAAISEAMARIAREMGVKILLDEPVEQLVFSGRRATGVRTSTRSLRADAVVIGADFARAMTDLVPDGLRRRWTNRKIESKQFSCSTFMLYLGLRGRLDDLPHHTIWLAQDYERNIAEIECRERLPDNPSFYIQNACVTDPSLAPEGCSTLYVLLPVPHKSGSVDWSHEAPGFRRLAFAQLAKIGLEGIEQRILFEKMLTPDDWEHDLHVYRGATFNLAHSLDQMLYRRPRNRFEDLDGVYLVGGGTHPGSGLPVIFESARITSRLVGKDLGLDHEVEAAFP